jgi:hypothetical protein
MRPIHSLDRHDSSNHGPSGPSSGENHTRVEPISNAAHFFCSCRGLDRCAKGTPRVRRDPATTRAHQFGARRRRRCWGAGDRRRRSAAYDRPGWSWSPGGWPSGARPRRRSCVPILACCRRRPECCVPWNTGAGPGAPHRAGSTSTSGRARCDGRGGWAEPQAG